MQFGESVRICFQKYATFSGRASRSEFWYFQLFSFLASTVAGILDVTFFPSPDLLSGPVSWIATVVLIVPSTAVGCRRLHDGDKTGWLQLIGLTIVGLIPLVVWWATRGTTGSNRYGPDPVGSKPLTA